jgi:hypothetical protein
VKFVEVAIVYYKTITFGMIKIKDLSASVGDNTAARKAVEDKFG